MCYRRTHSGLRRHHNGYFCDRLRLDKRLRWHGDHSSCDSLVGIHDIDDVRVVVDNSCVVHHGCVVVDIGDGGGRDHGVAAVDVVEVGAADLVSRLIDLAWGQRKPAHGGRCCATHGR